VFIEMNLCRTHMARLVHGYGWRSYFLILFGNYGSPSPPANFWGTFSSIVYNELDYIFLLNFGNLRSDLLLTSKSDF
jgi:hypothetical protein